MRRQRERQSPINRQSIPPDDNLIGAVTPALPPRVEGTMKLSDELIESLLFSLGSEVPTGEARRAPRITARGIAMLIPVKGGFRDEAREVYVRNISADGASLLLATPLQVEQFILQIPSQKAEPLQILCVVRHCGKSPDGGYKVGAQFVRFLPRRSKPGTNGRA
jgi:hypothetical protein